MKKKERPSYSSGTHNAQYETKRDYFGKEEGMAKKGTLFGKPKGQVVKHPGALRAAAKRAGMSTSAYAHKHAHDKGKTGKRARLALTFAKMRKHKG